MKLYLYTNVKASLPLFCYLIFIKSKDKKKLYTISQCFTLNSLLSQYTITFAFLIVIWTLDQDISFKDIFIRGGGSARNWYIL